MPANTAVAKKSKEVLPAHLKSTPMGNESAETIQSIPYLKLLADISPELKERHERFMPGAKEGYFVNSATKEVYGPSVEVVCCYTRSSFKVWTKFEHGGGFHGNFASEAEAHQFANSQPEPAKLEIKDTDDHALLIDGQPVLFSVHGAKLWNSRSWNKVLGETGLSRWAKPWLLEAELCTSKSSGKDYWRFKVPTEQTKYVSEEIAQAAEALYMSQKARETETTQ